MKEVYICKKCGLVSTIRSEYVLKLNAYICKECDKKEKDVFRNAQNKG